MPKIILTKGLPASGKTTWVKEEQKKDPNLVRVNKDDLRAMLHGGKWGKNNEKDVLAIRNFIVDRALTRGRNIVVDDTNLHSKHEIHLKQVAKKHNAEFTIKDFTSVSQEECIKRDLKRSNSVGSEVIHKMYKQFLDIVSPGILEPDPNLPTVIICDLDGTLCLFDGNPYERDFSKDKINKPVKSILDSNEDVKDIIFFSGRNGKFKDQTRKWLDDHGYGDCSLYMRAEGDTRKDVLVKKEMYEEHIEGKFNVLFVLDDRDQVVNLWRGLGLACFQVAEGNF